MYLTVSLLHSHVFGSKDVPDVQDLSLQTHWQALSSQSHLSDSGWWLESQPNSQPQKGAGQPEETKKRNKRRINWGTWDERLRLNYFTCIKYVPPSSSPISSSSSIPCVRTSGMLLHLSNSSVFWHWHLHCSERWRGKERKGKGAIDTHLSVNYSST